MKTWQIWSVFLLTFALVAAATVWLTMKTMELEAQREEDREQTELARREAELQERINSAMYRIDWILTPLIAQEAARPYYLYRSFYQRPSVFQLSTGKGASEPPRPEEPSPLLLQPSELVVLHFQIDEQNQITSPQRPPEKYSKMAALCCGVPADTFDKNNELVACVREFSDYQSIRANCPPVSTNNDASDWVSSFQTVYLDPNFSSNASFQSQEFDLQQQIREQVEQALPNEQEDNQQLAQVQRARSNKRGNSEYLKRRESAQKLAQSQWANNLDNGFMRFNNAPHQTPAQRLVHEGVMRPMWVKDQLILARRVSDENRELVQCCWLNWDKIRQALSEEVADILPDVRFEPIDSEVEPEQFGRLLAALPVRLAVEPETLLSTLSLDSATRPAYSISGIRGSLILAWIGLFLAGTASAILLHGVLRLSERRAAFVSAVTHELRTPLTTFRMYAEMLSEKMVPPEKQKRYTDTLKIQADRLSHLVDNVLQFARLERQPSEPFESIAVSNLFNGCWERLRQRAESAEMELELEVQADDNATVSVNLAKVEQIAFNLVDNACKYAKSATDRRIAVTVTEAGRHLRVSFQDFGPGVTPHFRKKLFQPFCKSDQEAANSAEGVGLGLALCKRMATSMGGQLNLEDTESGARFVLTLPIPQK